MIKMPEKPKIKVISFDLDGTLVDKNFDEAIWYKEVPKAYAAKHRISFDMARERVVREYEKESNKDHNWVDIEYWFNYFGITDWKKVIEDLRHMVKVYDEAIPVLKELRKKYKLVIITQADCKFIEVKMEVENLKDYFDDVFSTTSDFKELKKTEEIFNEIVKRLGVGKDEIIHLGDSRRFDYETPTRAGIRSFLLDRTGTEQGEHVINSLREIEGKLL